MSNNLEQFSDNVDSSEMANWHEPETGYLDLERPKVESVINNFNNCLANIPKVENDYLNVDTYQTNGEILVDPELENHHANMLKIWAPAFKDKKVLDLFCGVNPIKRYTQENNIPCDVTGVDANNKNADLLMDIKDLNTVIPPEQQFDVVTEFGGMSNVIDYETIKSYLKDDGVFIYGTSLQFHNENFSKIANGEAPMDDGVNDMLNNFEPVSVLKIKDTPTSLPDFQENEAYILTKKREINND